MNLKQYRKEYKESITNTEKFWSKKATKILSWSKPFTKIHNKKFGSDKWFEDGKLNACYNCIDRWVSVFPDKMALIFDSNDGESTKFTYKQTLERVCEISNQLKHLKKGDCVTLYLPMGPEAVFCALACARLGLTHNAVFGGFSPDSLRLRIDDSKSKMLITQDFAMRGEKRINFLENVVKAVQNLNIEGIVFDKHCEETSDALQWYNTLKNFKKWSQLEHCKDFVPCLNVEAEHSLFCLYTSGSTGMPKGLIHSTGGYLLYAAYTLKTAFDIRENDIFCCTADIGWITGHSYCIYGPLCLGITSVIVEGVPTYPTYYRFFDIVHKYKLTQLYTAPTAVRLLKKYFDTNPLDTSSYDLTSLRCLGSVGEPINKEAHKFFSESFGNLHIVDTYWQTETGGFLIAPIVGVKKVKPECASLPMPGIVPIITCDGSIAPTATLKAVLMNKVNELGQIYITRSWPGIARGILNNRKRYETAYFSTPFYFTGDEGLIDQDGDFWIRGRADDVINVSGHRISTAEVESVACTNENVAEAAVVSVSHEIKGQSMILFVVLKKDDPDYENSVKETVATSIGGFCRPDKVIECPGIPKTATGKIMRRVLRSLLTNSEIGDLSTCINIESIEKLKQIMLSAAVVKQID
ncbi:acetate-CoA ligase [Vittaforma corneae ATCC 50505]|uniref:acetate--CoA ligase n=1 Tax=Vittaforma corneae (strain ATCC 50505) TaxID=993615 RepID=L2GN47_VITCO|nr:acetate-CoA ligase [Vittaforma corneae ATCC 50505]ELA41925.1 acetate-CoA ligase [Vittaforma corneae ATCC 50505]